MKRKLNVLFITNNDGGAPMSLLNLIFSIKEWVNPIVLFPNEEYEYEKFKDAGIECIHIPFDLEIHYKDLFKSLIIKDKLCYLRDRLKNDLTINRKLPERVAELLHGREIDIVHTNTGAIDIGYVVARRLSAKHVWHLREFQDCDFNACPFHGWRLFKKHIMQSDAAIGITKAIFAHFDLNKHNNAYLISDAVMSAENIIFFKQKSNYIFYASNQIFEGKGLHDLLEAYGMSSLIKNGIRLKIAGHKPDFEYGNKLDLIIKKYNLTAMIDWLGFCDIKPYMVQAKVFCMPSLNEAMGRVAIEAMFYGCPVITRNAGGPKEFVHHHENGYLFNNVDELMSILENVTTKDQESIILRAQQFAIDNYSEEVYGQKIMDVYNSVLR